MSIDPTRNPDVEFNERGNPRVWLTWCERRNGIVELRGISLTRRHAEYMALCMREEQLMTEDAARKVDPNTPLIFQLDGLNPITKVRQEEMEAEHGYAAGDMRLALAAMTRPK